jgi:large conductance mechanosensitive channel
MSLLKEFKEFALKGNVMDLAVGVIIGAAFGGVVKAFTDDILMPPISSVANTDFSNHYYLLKAGSTPAPYATLKAAKEAGAVVLAWGNFVTVTINFLIVAFAIFMVVKAFNKMKKEEPKPEEPKGPTETELLSEIRDLLKKS